MRPALLRRSPRRRPAPQAVLREGLQHRFWIDQRRGWRFTNPNLEQLGLVRAEYQYIEDLARDDEEFAASPILRSAAAAERQEALQVLFDHMRTGLAVNTAALGRQKVEALTQTMRGQVKAPWSLEDEATVGVSVLMLDPPKRARIGPRDEERILRGTRQSGLARKIRAIRFGDTQLSAGDIPDVLKTLLHAAKKYGLVEEVSSPVGGIGCTLPWMGIGNNLPIWHPNYEIGAKLIAALVALLSSTALDYAARQKVAGTHLNFFYAEQLPVLGPNQFTQENLAFLTPRVLELTYTSDSMRPWAEDLGHTGAPFGFDLDRRAQLRAELDAFFARKYGLSRDELRYTLDPADTHGESYPSETFRGLKRNEIERYGEFRTQRLVLTAFDRLTGA